MNPIIKELISNLLRVLSNSSNFSASTSGFIFALSICFVTTLVEIFLHVNLIGSDQKSLLINDNNSLSLPFIFILGKHIVKNLPKITKLRKKILGIMRTFDQILVFVLVLYQNPNHIISYNCDKMNNTSNAYSNIFKTFARYIGLSGFCLNPWC